MTVRQIVEVGVVVRAGEEVSIHIVRCAHTTPDVDKVAVLLAPTVMATLVAIASAANDADPLGERTIGSQLTSDTAEVRVGNIDRGRTNSHSDGVDVLTINLRHDVVGGAGGVEGACRSHIGRGRDRACGGDSRG